MIVAGTLTNKMAPALRKVYDQVGPACRHLLAAAQRMHTAACMPTCAARAGNCLRRLAAWLCSRMAGWPACLLGCRVARGACPTPTPLLRAPPPLKPPSLSPLSPT